MPETNRALIAPVRRDRSPAGSWTAAAGRVGSLVLLLATLALAGAGCNVPAPAGGENLSVSVERAPWTLPGARGQVLTTEHYRIFTTADNRALVANLPGFMECAYRQYLHLSGLPEPPAAAGHLTIYVMADRAQWVSLTEQLTGLASQTYLKVESGGYCFNGQCVLWDLGHFATFSVAAHEGLHQFFQRRLRDGLPAWAEEGLCTQMEGFNLSSSTVRFDPARNVLRQTDLRRVITGGRRLEVSALLSTDPGEQVKGAPLTAPEYYGQLWALVMFIRSQQRYRAGLERMIADAAAGKLAGPSLPAPARLSRQFRRAIAIPAFQQYVERDLDAFQKSFVGFANRLARLE